MNMRLLVLGLVALLLPLRVPAPIVPDCADCDISDMALVTGGTHVVAGGGATGYLLCQVQGGRVVVLEELYLPDCSTHEACAVFDERAERYRARLGGNEWSPVPMAVHVYGDASGANRQHAGPSDWAIVKDFGKRVSDRYQMDFRLRSANPAVKDRIAAVNAMLQNAAGDRRLIVARECKELIADLERVQWKSDAAGNLRSELDGSDMKRTHISDALGYFVEKEFGLRERGGWGHSSVVR